LCEQIIGFAHHKAALSAFGSERHTCMALEKQVVKGIAQNYGCKTTTLCAYFKVLAQWQQCDLPAITGSSELH